MKGNNKSMRGHPNGHKHLRTKKSNNGVFGSGGSNSSNWRESTKTNVNDLTTNGYNNHHLTSAFVSLVGLYVEVQKTDGLIYEGILECVSSNLEIHLCHACQKTENEEKLENGGSTVESKGTLMFQFCDVVRCNAKNVDLDYAKREQLMTDTAISGGTGIIVERQLEKWQAGDTDPPLETLELESSENGRFDFDEMIQTNKENYGYESTFDVTMSNYMTPMEICDEETFRKREEEAERLAREMQKDARHKELENVDSGVGEEELFSSVSRSSSNSSFTGSVRNTKSGNRPKGGVQGPRFQKVRNQDDLTHNRGTQNQRISNGLPHRHTQQQQQHQSQPNYHHAGGETLNKANNNTENHGLKSYSSVAAIKQPNVTPLVTVNNNSNISNNSIDNNTNPKAVTRSPVGPLSDPVINIPHQNKGLPKQEHLNKAKQQYIADAQRNTAQVTTRINNSVSGAPLSSQEQNKAHMQESTIVPTTTSPVRQHPQSTDKTTLSYSRMATGKPELKNNAINEFSKPLRGAGELQKFGKVQKIHNEKKAEGDVSIEKLKEFKDIVINFEKSETASTTTQSKKSEETLVNKSALPSVASSGGNVQGKAVINEKNGISKNSKTSSVITSSLTTTTATISTVATSTTTSSITTSTLNPAAKEFNLNPTAKEFKPTFAKTPKPTTDYATTQIVQAQHMNQQQPGHPVLISQHQTQHNTTQEMMSQNQFVQQQLRPQSMVSYRPPYHAAAAAAVYEVPNTGPILNNPHHGGYNVHQQMFVINSNPSSPQYHQQHMMNNQQGQPFVPVQQMHNNSVQVRLINPVQQRMPSNSLQDGGIPSSYILQNAGTAHSSAHQQSIAASHNYHQQQQQHVQTPSSPASTMPPHQQYVINNQNSTYHQPHISMHSQGTTQHYQQRPVYSAGQPPIVVVPNFHHPGGQPGMIHNFQQGN